MEHKGVEGTIGRSIRQWLYPTENLTMGASEPRPPPRLVVLTTDHGRPRGLALALWEPRVHKPTFSHYLPSPQGSSRPVVATMSHGATRGRQNSVLARLTKGGPHLRATSRLVMKTITVGRLVGLPSPLGSLARLRLSIQTLKALDVVPKVIIFEGGKNLTLNAVTNSSHEVIELRGNSASHLHASPINEKGNRLNRTDSWEMFLNENGQHTSMKL
ncbi:hypothetical protein MTR67_006964 [Solanum verrucosum]|uniref:Uncharacterized protein n=1 Tax=Solanum verrucosum TaxID=315347 RepID=A0AAF0Q553_SOLVR|nr:hypothetical protein MTR67_006964 [Solanum verrucosum]